ncbi:MAG: zinc ribbon domain-containing protein [Hominimerdicola sp.]
MADVKRYKKKLTNSGGGICVLSFIAFLFAVGGACVDFIVTAIYNQYYYNKRDYIFASDAFEYIKIFDKSIILAVFSFAVMCYFLSARRKKKLGAGFSAVVTVTSLALAVEPVAMIVQKLMNGELTNAVNYDNDYAKFYAFSDLIACALPAFSSFFMLLAGIILIGRVISEDFYVEIPVVKNIAVMPENKEESLPEQKELPYESDKSNSSPIIIEDNVEPASAEVEMPDNDEDSKTLVCSKCGFAISENAKFCRNCGKQTV